MAKQAFVFVSHASVDKPYIRFIVDALLAADLLPWVDKPSKLGYSGEELDRILRLHAGQSWHAQLVDAAEQAGCMLVCWSKRALEARALGAGADWSREIFTGERNGTLVPCVIEHFDFREISSTFSLQQSHDLTPELDAQTREQHLRLLIHDIRKKLGETTGQGFEFDPEQLKRRRRSPRFLTYLVGRDQQQSVFSDVLQACEEQPDVRPLLFAGPENEAPQGFLERLQVVSAEPPRPGWHDYAVAWPSYAVPDEFERSYRRALSDQLRTPADDAAIARKLGQQQRPVAILHRIGAGQWDRFGGDRLKAWLDYWTGIARLRPGVTVLPIVQLVLPEARPGWRRSAAELSAGALECPPDPLFDFKREVRNRDMLKAILRLAEPDPGGRLPITFLRLLPPALPHESEDWLFRLRGRSDAGREALAAGIGALYPRGRDRTDGVNQQIFSDRITPILERNP